VAESRRIRTVVKSRATIEGAGVHLHRELDVAFEELERGNFIKERP
jgi:hypothetical protein